MNIYKLDFRSDSYNLKNLEGLIKYELERTKNVKEIDISYN